MKYYEFYKTYPKEAIYVDENLKPTKGKECVHYLKCPSGKWKHYEYFFKRWEDLEYPVNFKNAPNPNHYSIGIELLTVGSKIPDPAVYSEQMYHTLNRLIEDLCRKYTIPRTRANIIGHEDVNPLARFGWDPNQGFEWDKIM